MKKYIGLFAFFLLQAGISLSQNSLQIHIKNIELIEGTLKLRLTNDSVFFQMDTIQNHQMIEEKVSANEMFMEFKDLPNGVYAFAVYQDLNENGQLDTKKFGIPAEPFAFSNDALGKFGPPKFSQASFELNNGGVHQEEVSMIYHKPKRKDKNVE